MDQTTTQEIQNVEKTIGSFFTSPVFLALEKMVKVAIFWGLSAFVTELITLIANDKTIAIFIQAHPYAIAGLMVINMALAGFKKYIDAKKAQ